MSYETMAVQPKHMAVLDVYTCRRSRRGVIVYQKRGFILLLWCPLSYTVYTYLTVYLIKILPVLTGRQAHV